jgi:hypothetical protein
LIAGIGGSIAALITGSATFAFIGGLGIGLTLLYVGAALDQSIAYDNAQTRIDDNGYPVQIPGKGGHSY